MATSYCLDPSQVSDFANKDVNRIVGKVAEVLARKSPFIDILDGGTLENVSDVVRSVVQERAVSGTSLANPTFFNDVTMCNGPINQDQVGSTEYQFQLQSIRGQGPLVCVKTSRTAFKGSYLQAQISLEKNILQIMNADIRYQILKQSGVKYVVNSNYGLGTALTGDMQAINTPFLSVLPNSPATFALVKQLINFEKEEMLADGFNANGEDCYKVIASQTQIDRFRDELNVRDDLRWLAAGKYELGGKSLTSYTWSGPYRGALFGVDAQPLRFNQIDGNGQPILIEPEIGVPTTRGMGARRNPAWVTAAFEIMFIVAPDSFKRLTPQQYTGEGTFKFAPQLYMGELEWFYIKDTCNKFGDFGQHLYQISRAYQPIRPQNILPIAYSRCSVDLGLTPCSSSQIGL